MSLTLRAASALLATLAAGCSCAEAHERDADAVSDGAIGDDTTNGDDARYPDGAAVPDADCEYIAGFRRCDSQCSRRCNALTGRCQNTVGVCAGPRPGMMNSCGFTPDRDGYYCSDGSPCAAHLPLSATECSGVPYCGPCMPPEFCIASAGRGLPPFQCVWSDGTPVVTGPPPGTCPASPVSMHPFCGGVCGYVDCQANAMVSVSSACVAVSDTRSFGVCELAPFRCNEHDGRTQYLLDLCTTRLRQGECACLVPSPLPAGTTTRFGFIVLRSVCRAYRDHFPGNADCVDGTWTSIP